MKNMKSYKFLIFALDLFPYKRLIYSGCFWLRLASSTFTNIIYLFSFPNIVSFKNSSKFILYYIGTGLLFFFPSLVFAETFAEVLGIAQSLIHGLFPIMTLLAVIYFLWGAIKYIKLSDQPEERSKGRDLMIHGIIAVFVMVSFWGLVDILINTFFSSPTDLLLDVTDVPQL